MAKQTAASGWGTLDLLQCGNLGIHSERLGGNPEPRALDGEWGSRSLTKTCLNLSSDRNHNSQVNDPSGRSHAARARYPWPTWPSGPSVVVQVGAEALPNEETRSRSDPLGKIRQLTLHHVAAQRRGHLERHL